MKRSRQLVLIGQALISLVFILSAFCFPVLAASDSRPDSEILQEATDFFRQANELAASAPAASEALYRKAAMRFELLAQERGIHNGKLYYNLGNSYFLLGDIGRAILNYRRAEQYIASDVNLQQNLAFALGKRLDRVEEKEQERVLKTIFFFHYDFPPKVRTLLFLFSYLCFWGFAVWRIFQKRPFLVWCLWISLLPALLFGGSLLAGHFGDSEKSHGVLLVPETVARKGDGDNYQPSFQQPLHAGTEFELLEKRQQWWRIELSDGRQCWIPASDAALVRE